MTSVKAVILVISSKKQLDHNPALHTRWFTTETNCTKLHMSSTDDNILQFQLTKLLADICIIILNLYSFLKCNLIKSIMRQFGNYISTISLALRGDARIKPQNNVNFSIEHQKLLRRNQKNKQCPNLFRIL
jgi:hypothetical protein